MRILQPKGAHARAPCRAALQRRAGRRSDLPFLRRLYPQDLDSQRAARHVQHGRENPNRLSLPEVLALALQAAGRDRLPDPAQPKPNRSTLPIIRAPRAKAFPVPIAQSTERECPKLQVAGESPAGDTISSGCGSTAEYGLAKAETTVRLRSPAPLPGDVAHQLERSFDMREVKRAALFVPTISDLPVRPAEPGV